MQEVQPVSGRRGGVCAHRASGLKAGERVCAGARLLLASYLSWALLFSVAAVSPSNGVVRVGEEPRERSERRAICRGLTAHNSSQV